MSKKQNLIFCGLALVTALGAQSVRAAEPASSGSAPAAPQGVIRLDETVISGNQELPKVLYILPWREPGGLPDIELESDFTEMDVFRRLYPPAYRRELSYYKSLEATKSEE
ncbi:MAG: hypothetical protein R3E82_12775 [Pseudomonadales bacterium]|nr:hypothetical protein [Pseudomonadales bacterium]